MEKKTPFKELSKEAKVQYIWDYYKIHIFVGIIALIFVISIIVHYVTYKEPVLTLNLINCSIDSDPSDLEEYLDGFLKDQDFNPSKQEISYTNNLYLDMSKPEACAQDLMSLDVMVASQSSNVIITDPDTFDGLAKRSYFIDASSYLSDEQLEQYKDDIVYATDPDTNETYPVGIHITDSNNSFMSTNTFDDYVIGLCYSKDHATTEQAFINYILK